MCFPTYLYFFSLHRHLATASLLLLLIHEMTAPLSRTGTWWAGGVPRPPHRGRQVLGEQSALLVSRGPWEGDARGWSSLPPTLTSFPLEQWSSRGQLPCGHLVISRDRGGAGTPRNTPQCAGRPTTEHGPPRVPGTKQSRFGGIAVQTQVTGVAHRWAGGPDTTDSTNSACP